MTLDKITHKFYRKGRHGYELIDGENCLISEWDNRHAVVYLSGKVDTIPAEITLRYAHQTQAESYSAWLTGCTYDYGSKCYRAEYREI